MMMTIMSPATRFCVLAVTLAGILGVGTSFAQSTQSADEPVAPAAKPAVPAKPAVAAKKSTVSAKPAVPVGPSRYKPDRFAGRAGSYYKLVWGVDSLAVRWAESGEVIRFNYRVLDAEKAKTLNDVKLEPSLNDARAGVSLVVPTLEKVGKLRQSETPEEGKSYWMAFSNKGRLVKRGDRVDIVIGQFHADGLVVD